jgi:hypothetical protein
MPTYPEMTLGQLSDIVAYLTSLTQGGPQSSHAAMMSLAATRSAASGAVLSDLPEPPGGPAANFFTQSYNAQPGRLAAFEQWFATQGRQQFLAADGLVSIETIVDLTRPGAAMTTIVGFRDEAALRNFMGDPATVDLWKQFDAFIGPHGHQTYTRLPLYRAPGLSVE